MPLYRAAAQTCEGLDCHDPAYVAQVATLAASYGVMQTPSGVALAQISSGSILTNANISLTELARQDIAAGASTGECCRYSRS